MIDQEAVKAELGKNEDIVEDEPNDIIEGESEVIIEDEPQFSEDQQKAFDKGWRPKDQFDGDPDEWRTAKQFNEYGDMIGRIRQQTDQMRTMQTGFEERLSNVNVMHKGQLDSQMTQLNSQFKTAVESGDTEKAGEIRDQQVAVNTQLNHVNTPTPTINNDKQFQAQWEADNPWIYESSDKANVAKGTFSNALARGKSVPEAIQLAEEAIKPYSKPASNRNRAAPASVTNGQPTNRAGKERSLSMSDITHQESQMRGMFKDEKSFLKAVQDSRVGA